MSGNRHSYITESNLERLQSIVEIASEEYGGYLKGLEKTINRAKVVSPKKVPPNVITMNSMVRLQDLDTGEEKICVLVYPGKTRNTPNGVSVTTGIGTALIGRRQEDVIEYDGIAGSRRVKILELMYQPERTGIFSA